MNVVKILLVLGLGYVALTQKVEKTRNMLLVVTGLLAFCMFSMEGFTIPLTDTTIFTGGEGTGHTVTTGSGASQIVYTLPALGDYDSSEDIPNTGYSCTIGGSPGVIGKSSATDYNTQGTLDTAVRGSSVDITKIFTCEAETTGQSCSAGKTAGKKCPDYYKVSSTANCAADPCVDNDFAANGGCCEKLCSEADCEEHGWWGLGEDGDECGAPSGLFNFTVQKCKTDS
jgi:hypothetical protein